MKLYPAAVLGPWALGIATLSWIVRQWKATKPSFHGTMCLAAAAIWGVLWAIGPQGALGTGRGWWVAASASASVLLAAAGIGYWFDTRVSLGVSDFLHGIGILVSCIGVAIPAIGGPHPDLALARAAAATAFLGSATAGMTLGHWYLVDPQMDRRAISRLAKLFLLSFPLEIAALLLRPGVLQAWSEVRGPISGYLPPFWVATALAGVLFGLGALGSLRVRGYSGVMAATGLSYLAILAAFGVDVIGKALIGSVG